MNRRVHFHGSEYPYGECGCILGEQCCCEDTLAGGLVRRPKDARVTISAVDPPVPTPIYYQGSQVCPGTGPVVDPRGTWLVSCPGAFDSGLIWAGPVCTAQGNEWYRGLRWSTDPWPGYGPWQFGISEFAGTSFQGGPINVVENQAVRSVSLSASPPGGDLTKCVTTNLGPTSNIITGPPPQAPFRWMGHDLTGYTLTVEVDP